MSLLHQVPSHWIYVAVSALGLYVVYRIIKQFWRPIKKGFAWLWKSIKNARMITNTLLFFRSNRYLKALRGFRRALPWRIRHLVFEARPYLYLNAAEDQLVTKGTDAERFRQNYLRNFQQESECHFHLTNQYFITEIPKTTLLSEDASILPLLRRLYRKLYRYQRPTIIISLPLSWLVDSPETTLKYTQVLRQHINNLTAIKNKPIDICLSLSSDETLAGLSAFQKIAHGPLSGLTFIQPSQLDTQSLANHFIDQLNTVVLESPTSDTVKAINFCDKLQQVAPRLRDFIAKLTYNDHLSAPPKLLGICFSEAAKTQNNPFDLLTGQRKPTYHRRNKIWLLSGGFLLILLAIATVKTHEIVNQAANNMMVALKKSTNPTDVQDAFNEDESIAYAQIKSSPWSVFFPKQHLFNRIDAQLSSQLLANAIIPRLNNTTDPDQAVFAYFILEAPHHPDIKALILNHLYTWSVVTGLNPELIHHYVSHTRQHLPLPTIDLSQLRYPEGQSVNLNYYTNVMQNEYTYLQQNPYLTLTNVRSFLNKVYVPLMQHVIASKLIYQFYPEIAAKTPSDFQVLMRTYKAKRYPNLAPNIEIKKAHQLAQAISQYPDSYYLPKTGTDLDAFVANVKTILQQYHNMQSTENPKAKQWDRLVTTAKINALIERFFSHHIDIFSRQNINLISSISPDQITNDNFLFKESYTVPGLFTRTGLDSYVIPSIKRYQGLLTALKHFGMDTRTLETNFNASLQHYVNAYRQAYVQLVQGFSFNTNSVESLSMVLSAMLNTRTSPPMQLLQTVHFNTHFPHNADHAFMKPVEEYFASYQQLTATPKKSKGNLATPKALLTFHVLLDNVYNRINQTDNAWIQSDRQAEVTNALAGIANNIYLNNKNSYLVITNKWLDQFHMPTPIRAPFEKLILTIYRVGLQHIQAQIQTTWETQIAPIIAKAELYFPFNPHANTNISSDEMNALFSPTGQFWETYNREIKPFLSTPAGQQAASKRFGDSPLPKTIAAEIKKVRILTAHLWTKTGEPKPIQINVAALALTNNLIGKQRLPEKMSYLTNGNEMVYGINSAPVWTSVNLHWWNPSQTSVGLELSNGKDESMTTKNQMWSFYHTIEQAQTTDHQHFSWSIQVDNKTVPVAFETKANPMALFQLTGAKTHA